MNVGEVCSREVYVVERTEALAEAVREMRQRHVGAIVVVEQQGMLTRPIGIVTDRDLIFATRGDGIDLSVSVTHVMTSCPLTLAEDSGLYEAIKLMSAHGVRRAPVVGAGGDLVGIVSVDDLVPVVAEELTALAKLLVAQARHERNA